jgi:hypothetical protein
MLNLGLLRLWNLSAVPKNNISENGRGLHSNLKECVGAAIHFGLIESAVSGPATQFPK